MPNSGQRLKWRPSRNRWLGVLSVLLLSGCTEKRHRDPDNPDAVFDGLTASEIERVVAAVRAKDPSPDVRFASVALLEPDKAGVMAGRPVERVARVVTYVFTGDVLSEFDVDVGTGMVVARARVTNAQPRLMGTDARLADSIVRADPRWVAALQRRGIKDLGRVVHGTWSAGYFGDSSASGRRVRIVPTIRDAPGDRDFLRPVEGLSAEVNLTNGTVTSLLDTLVGPIPPARQLAPEAAYVPPAAPRQNGNDGIRIRGHSVSWRQWRLHVAPDRREGVVLHRVRYVEGQRERSVLYRAAVSEMVVPYGDPDRGWFFRNVFDAGELGLGQFPQPLRAGVDVPAGAHFIDAVFADEMGRPFRSPRAVAVYERDGGLAWRHLDLARRARQLVIEWISSLGNYEYGFAWILHEDGTIEQRTTLTGILSVKGAAPSPVSGEDPSTLHGQRVAPQVIAPHHQHFFVFRLDTDVDASEHHQVLELDGRGVHGANAAGSHNAMVAAVTVLPSERTARRFTDGASARRWLVQNRRVVNALRAPVGYALVPGENAQVLADSSAWIRKRAGMLDAQLWVTPYRPNELFAAGTYPNQNRGGEGLPTFTRGDAPVTDADVVLWYVMGITHLPRPEDWPIMPAHVAGFKLVPTAFFDANPLMRR